MWTFHILDSLRVSPACLIFMQKVNGEPVKPLNREVECQEVSQPFQIKPTLVIHPRIFSLSFLSLLLALVIVTYKHSDHTRSHLLHAVIASSIIGFLTTISSHCTVLVIMALVHSIVEIDTFGKISPRPLLAINVWLGRRPWVVIARLLQVRILDIYRNLVNILQQTLRLILPCRWRMRGEMGLNAKLLGGKCQPIVFLG